MILAVTTAKAHIITFGCQMNRQESGVMAELLGRAGYVMTDRVEEAGLVVIETCAIRDRAEHKVYSLLGRLNKRRREESPDLRIALCGCIATDGTADDLVRRHGVDVVLGPRRIARIAEAVESSREAPVIDLGNEWILPPDDVTAPDIPGLSAFVTVMQGCSNACAFCVVPSRRGPVKSRVADEIIRDLRLLEEKGYREVTLLGQNVSAWGRDRGDGEQLIDLLRRVEAECAIPRIRFGTSHPAYIDERFCDLFGGLRRVMPHLHLPVQSGSDAILERMRRGYTATRYREITTAIRAARPGTSIMTDFITGFDGETEEDHAATLALIRDIGFDGVYIFAYSERPGTAASRTPSGEPVPPERRLERCREALAVAEDTALIRRARDVDRTVEVLVERPGVGRTPENILTSFEGRGEAGEFVPVQVTRAAPFALFGVRT